MYLADLTISESMAKDLFRVNIGMSEDGYIQYSITECLDKNFGHCIYLIFMKQ